MVGKNGRYFNIYSYHIFQSMSGEGGKSSKAATPEKKSQNYFRKHEILLLAHLLAQMGPPKTAFFSIHRIRHSSSSFSKRGEEGGKECIKRKIRPPDPPSNHAPVLMTKVELASPSPSPHFAVSSSRQTFFPRQLLPPAKSD